MYPLYYHTHHARHTEDLLFWEALAQKQGGPILELGCGTGRVLIPLRQKGYRVMGLDSDFTMLSFLCTTLGEVAAPVFQADMAAFRLAELFSLILMPCNTLSTLSVNDRRETFARVREHLLPGGIFAASLPNPVTLASLPRRGEPETEENFLHPTDGEPVVVSSAWKRTAHHVTFTWHYDHLLPDGLVERIRAEARHELVPLEEYKVEMQTAGLKVTAIIGDFDYSPFTDDSPELIVLARSD